LRNWSLNNSGKLTWGRGQKKSESESEMIRASNMVGTVPWKEWNGAPSRGNPLWEPHQSTRQRWSPPRCDFLYYGFLCRTCGADSTPLAWVPSHTLPFPALSVSVLLPTKHHVTSDQSPITGERGMFPIIIAFFLIHLFFS